MTAPTRRPREETARLGDEIYERDIRPQVEDEHDGEYVAIDVDSRDWAVSDDLLAAAKRLREMRPEAVDVWTVRVGYRATASIRGRIPAENPVITGSVNANYEAVITVPVRGPEGQTRQVEAVVDTGFNRFLILPPALVTELGLPFVTSSPVILADGSEESFDVHDVSVIWDGQPRDVYA